MTFRGLEMDTTDPATSVEELRDRIETIGARLARCTLACAGVRCDLSAGSMPRCLLFESRGCTTLGGGVIVVGMNPGRADKDEQELIKTLFAAGDDPPVTYRNYLAWFSEATQHIPFYTLMRAALATMGFLGPILWTEIVKCESGDPVVVAGRKRPVAFGVREPFLETTVPTCSDKFLREELAACPSEWPLIAAGLGLGDYLDKNREGLAGRRSIVAAPHPTGCKEFLKIFEPKELSTRSEVLDRISRALAAPGTFARLSGRSKP